MDRLLARLERRFGRYAIHGLTYYLVAIMGFVFVLELTNPGFVRVLALDRGLILRGQVWRLFTYIFVPFSMSPIAFLFEVYWLYTMGTVLEAEWGAFKYQAFWGIGIVLTSVMGFFFDVPATNVDLAMSLFLAFATLFPDYEIRVFLFVPVKVKWLALLDAIAILYRIGALDGLAKVLPLIAIGNYLLFFAGTLLEQVRRGAFTAHRAGVRSSFRNAIADSEPKAGRRTCKACGVTDEDRTVEFRVCTCEKCGGKPTDFCITHARNH